MNEESTETVPEDVLPHFLGHPRRVPDKASTDSRCVSPLRPVTTREGGQRQTTWRGEWNEEDIAEVMHKLRILREGLTYVQLTGGAFRISIRQLDLQLHMHTTINTTPPSNNYIRSSLSRIPT